MLEIYFQLKKNEIMEITYQAKRFSCGSHVQALCVPLTTNSHYIEKLSFKSFCFNPDYLPILLQIRTGEKPKTEPYS